MYVKQYIVYPLSRLNWRILNSLVLLASLEIVSTFIYYYRLFLPELYYIGTK